MIHNIKLLYDNNTQKYCKIPYVLPDDDIVLDEHHSIQYYIIKEISTNKVLVRDNSLPTGQQYKLQDFTNSDLETNDKIVRINPGSTALNNMDTTGPSGKDYVTLDDLGASSFRLVPIIVHHNRMTFDKQDGSPATIIYANRQNQTSATFMLPSIPADLPANSEGIPFAGWYINGKKIVPNQTMLSCLDANKTALPEWRDQVTFKIVSLYDKSTVCFEMSMDPGTVLAYEFWDQNILNTDENNGYYGYSFYSDSEGQNQLDVYSSEGITVDNDMTVYAYGFPPVDYYFSSTQLNSLSEADWFNLIESIVQENNGDLSTKTFGFSKQYWGQVGVSRMFENTSITHTPKALFFGYLNQANAFFKNCQHLTTITPPPTTGLPYKLFDSGSAEGVQNSYVSDISEMFMNCTNLESWPDVSPLATINGIFIMRSMFEGCTKLKSLKRTSNFVTYQGNNFIINRFAYGCSELTDITGLFRNFDYPESETNNAYYHMSETEDAFTGCGKLTYCNPYWLVRYPYSGQVTKNCYWGCTRANNYSDVPEAWGGPAPLRILYLPTQDDLYEFAGRPRPEWDGLYRRIPLTTGRFNGNADHLKFTALVDTVATKYVPGTTNTIITPFTIRGTVLGYSELDRTKLINEKVEDQASPTPVYNDGSVINIDPSSPDITVSNKDLTTFSDSDGNLWVSFALPWRFATKFTKTTDASGNITYGASSSGQLIGPNGLYPAFEDMTTDLKIVYRLINLYIRYYPNNVSGQKYKIYYRFDVMSDNSYGINGAFSKETEVGLRFLYFTTGAYIPYANKESLYTFFVSPSSGVYKSHFPATENDIIKLRMGTATGGQILYTGSELPLSDEIGASLCESLDLIATGNINTSGYVAPICYWKVPSVKKVLYVKDLHVPIKIYWNPRGGTFEDGTTTTKVSVGNYDAFFDYDDNVTDNVIVIPKIMFGADEGGWFEVTSNVPIENFLHEGVKGELEFYARI